MVRLGIVGFGLHAEKRMMPGFALAKHCQVTALSRRDMTKAQASARKWNIPLAFDSAEKLCHSDQVDAVFVTTPNSCHLQDVLTAIKSGKPVLCEKPLGTNANECRQMVEASRKAKVLFGVAHVFRFENSVNRMRTRVAAGQIGRPIFVRSEFSFPGGNDHPRTWLHDLAVAGGGPIVDIGVHCIDTLRFILQDEVERATASAMHDKLSGEMEAASILTLEFSKGTLGTVLVSYRADYRTPLELVGEAGVLRADDCLNVERPIELQLWRDRKMTDSETVSNADAYAKQVDAFAIAIENKSEFLIPGEEGWQNQEVLDAAYRSIKSGKAESIPRVSK
jgi:1,5-anhydro-D-fructose reductase (1,5-anhydro-D-mannitol-forming)